MTSTVPAAHSQDRTWDEWSVSGTVVPGTRRGRHIGVPTATIAALDVPVDLPDGVYAGVVQLLDARSATERFHPAAVFVRTVPTAPGSPRTVEAHLLDVCADLHGVRVQLRSCRRLRGTTAFDSALDLLAAMEQDIAATRRIVGTPGRAVPGLA